MLENIILDVSGYCLLNEVAPWYVECQQKVAVRNKQVNRSEYN